MVTPNFPKHIRCKNITKLYHGKFPFKVVSTNPAGLYVPPSITAPYNSGMHKLEIAKINRIRERYFKQWMKAAPPVSEHWRFLDTHVAFIIYFERLNDFETFVDINQKRISELHCPKEIADIEFLKSNLRTEIRDYPYYGRYKYCIHLKPYPDPAISKEMCEWFDDTFGDSREDRCHADNWSVPKIMTNVKDDIFMLQLAFPKQILKITTAILRTELNEPSTNT